MKKHFALALLGVLLLGSLASVAQADWRDHRHDHGGYGWRHDDWRRHHHYYW